MVDEPATDDSAAETPRSESRASSRGVGVPLGMLIFVFGTAAGFLLAFSGLGLIEDTAGIVLLAFLCVLMFIGAFGLLLVIFRKPLLRRLFGFAETQLELFSEPLSRVTRGAIDRNPRAATDAARDLVHMALARYAWISTRRWIIGSLTALIAAMAALAGTALLFRQNVLLQEQSVLFAEQNLRIDNQIQLETYGVQLAEAARNAQLAVEITALAGLLGERVNAAQPGASAEALPLLDPFADIDLGLLMRITSASRATKPYRFLETGLNPQDQSGVIRAAMERRRDDLPETFERLGATFGFDGPLPDTGSVALNDRPASPERGQLFEAMTNAGIRAFERFNLYGLDFSYAHAPGLRLYQTSFQGGELSYAALDFAQVFESDFAGSFMFNARMRRAQMRDTNFGALPGSAINPPFAPDVPLYVTTLTGADFTAAMIRRGSFAAINGLAMNFDEAVLIGTDFTDAAIAASTFRGAAVFDVNFTGADLRSVDFDGAYVIGADAMERFAATAAPGSFRPERFALDRIEPTEAFDNTALFQNVEVEELLQLAGAAGIFRVRRVAPFEN
ncbi:pentapeptide repeat-containing protein [Pseudaestuariivita sp.]|uniref:pentapeptide repeat-containing protein n=1 Tax=Pseudaestuariivita sp. TaxID=2211669 RepID=UPI0040593E67